jgi:glycosyltransferase involved in cell wall biosynthesis
LTSTVSVIIPCFNEEATIRLLLDAVGNQTYPCSNLEVIIADGMSTDRTRETVDQFCRECSGINIRIVDNPSRIIPAGLNRAIEVSSGEYIVRLDAHSIPAPDYIEKCVQDIDRGVGENVGGVWEIKPGADTWTARSIARAAAHPLGVGDALYRYTHTAGPVDTVPFGAFRSSLIQKIGLFDESLQSNEDYEFNARIRQANGTVWLDPSIHSVYFARATFADLARQYFRYGYWKYRMLKRYPATLRWRQALPPVFVFSLIFFAILGFFIKLAWFGLALEILTYFIILFATSIQLAIQSHSPAFIWGIPSAIATMHTAWGAGFLWSLVKSFFNQLFLPEKK